MILDEQIIQTASHTDENIAEPCAFVWYCTNVRSDGTDCDGTVITVCMEEGTYWGADTHTPLLSEECTVLYFASRLYEYCSTCETFFNEVPASVCYQMHSSCWRGPIYYVCTGTHMPEIFED